MARLERLDVRLVEAGLVESREQAQRLILAGDVLVNGQMAAKPSQGVAAEAELALKARPRFVSRGGEKLEFALDTFGLDVAGLTCLDAGASTGGFTDCLLQRGAARVYAVDVGHNQLHWRLRQDPRVVVMEGVNARYLAPSDLGLGVAPSFAVADVAFISLCKVLPAIVSVLARPARMVTLVKPQFEAARHEVGRGGVVRDPEVRARTVESVRQFGVGLSGVEWVGVCTSPLLGPAGNVEFLAHWRVGSPGGENEVG